MALRNHNLPSGGLKNYFGGFKVSKGHSNSFSASWASKKRLGRSWLREELSSLMALKNHTLPCERLKKDFGEVDEAMMQGVESSCEIIFCILAIAKTTWTKSLK
jgi:hypothetical protein